MITLKTSAKAFVAGTVAFAGFLAIYLGAPAELVAAAQVPLAALFVYRKSNAQVTELGGTPAEGE